MQNAISVVRNGILKSAVGRKVTSQEMTKKENSTKKGVHALTISTEYYYDEDGNLKMVQK